MQENAFTCCHCKRTSILTSKASHTAVLVKCPHCNRKSRTKDVPCHFFFVGITLTLVSIGISVAILLLTHFAFVIVSVGLFCVGLRYLIVAIRMSCVPKSDFYIEESRDVLA
ncbi:uncharacterized protein LOC117647217 [Thrips palmi]|uniref:Uncharacterized protein LOC117647217 n=1 Tax=Thrips palmi TaxID=161013 RepID=A0A6P8Z3V5_THRPL|nr:uncharacterized protein LOC117647217 [Thrips palmi]XP_034244750.1 uncharacterized protein LOC117647217 [Thrips palmi]